MSCMSFIETDSFLVRIDPRARILLGLAVALLTAGAQRPLTAGAALTAMLLLAAGGRLPWRAVARRLVSVNVFLAVLAPFLLLSAANGSLRFTPENLPQLALIVLKANAVVLAITVCLSTIEVVTLAHALSHMRLPPKLIQLFVFTVRYIEVLHLEHLRVKRAARARGFHLRAGRHVYRTLAAWVGNLLVRSFDRSDRVLAAMKCRGYTGRFHLLRHFHAGRHDAVFTAASALLVALLAWVEWS